MFYTKEVIFIHVPLSGGKSVSKSFGEKEGGKVYNGVEICAHATAQEVLTVMGPKEYKNRWSFAVMRNPWKRMVSMYYCYCLPGKLQKHFGSDWLHVYNNTRTFRDFFFNYPRGQLFGTSGSLWSAQSYWTQGVNKVYNMDSPKELNDTMAMKGHVNGIHWDHSNHFNPHNPYQSYYDEEMKCIVEEYFYKDIELFNYTFE